MMNNFTNSMKEVLALKKEVDDLQEKIDKFEEEHALRD